MCERAARALAVALLTVAGSTAAAVPEAAWEEIGRGEHCVVFSRGRPGSEIREMRAVGTFDAPLARVHEVLDDLGNYQSFMPLMKVSRIVKTEGGVTWTYQRVQPPLISERDYTLRVHHTQTTLPDGRVVIKHAFHQANAAGPPAVDGVVRVAVLEGHWELVPSPDDKTTKGTYYLYTSPGGSLPSWLVNAANNTTVPGIFEAVKKRIRSGRTPKPSAAE